MVFAQQNSFINARKHAPGLRSWTIPVIVGAGARHNFVRPRLRKRFLAPSLIFGRIFGLRRLRQYNPDPAINLVFEAFVTNRPGLGQTT